MYCRWLSLCSLSMCIFNVVWFNMVLIWFIATQKMREDSVSPWNIPHFVGIFAKGVPYAVSCVVHWFMDLPISLIIFFVNSM